MLEIQIIQAAEQIGCEMIPERDNIRVMNINSLPSHLKEKIIENKKQILDILKRDIQAKEAGFIIGLTGQMYFCSINKNSILYMEELNGNWELWRETYQVDRRGSRSINVVYRSSEFKNVILKAKKYFDFVQREQNRTKLL